MEFNDFIKQGKVKKGEKDKALAKSILGAINQDLRFLDKLEIDKLSSRKLMCNYYDVLRAIIEAISALDGLKVYSHEAYTFYLRELKCEESLSLEFDRFRKIRNKLTYYGKNIAVEEASSNIKEMKKIIKVLKEKYLRIIINKKF